MEPKYPHHHHRNHSPLEPNLIYFLSSWLVSLTLNLLTTTIVAPPSNASKWQMGFNLAFKGLKTHFIQ